MRKYLLFLLILMGSGISYLFYHYYIDPKNLYLEKLKGFESSYEAPLDENVHKLLKQKFTYLGEGNQTYAFLGEDKETVLKIFKMHVLVNDEFRTKRLFNGYKVAYELDKENSGLFYVHLKQTHKQFPEMDLVDRLGFDHKVDPDQMAFILQRKSRVSKQVFEELFAQGREDEAKAKFTALLVMIQEGQERGVMDNDHNIMINTGFIGERPIRFDTGKIVYSEEIKDPEMSKEDIRKLVDKRVLGWIRKHYPSKEDEFKAYLYQKFEL